MYFQRRTSLVDIYLRKNKNKTSSTDSRKALLEDNEKSKHWKKLRNAVHFIGWVIWRQVNVKQCLKLFHIFRVCKKESKNIETLPSSFSHLYSSNPDDLLDIPRHHQRDILDICGDEISLYLNNQQTRVEAGADVRHNQVSPSYDKHWQDHETKKITQSLSFATPNSLYKMSVW